jgi:hypothetical protein
MKIATVASDLQLTTCAGTASVRCAIGDLAVNGTAIVTLTVNGTAATKVTN